MTNILNLISRPGNNLKKYKIKHIAKNTDILENSRYESKQDEYMRLQYFDFITKSSSDRKIYKTSQGLYIQCGVDNGS